MPGGHSSVPPEHTSSKPQSIQLPPDLEHSHSPPAVGILSRLLVELEANPYLPTLTSDHPYLPYLTCLAEHAPEVGKDFKRAVENPKKWDGLARKLARESARNRAFLATTQAIDLIEGGVKVNALPEVATGM